MDEILSTEGDVDWPTLMEMFTCDKLVDLRTQAPHDAKRPQRPRYIEIRRVFDRSADQMEEIKRLLWPGDVVAFSTNTDNYFAVWAGDEPVCAFTQCHMTRCSTLEIIPDSRIVDAIDWYSRVVQQYGRVSLVVPHTDAGLKLLADGRAVPKWSKVFLEYVDGKLVKVRCRVPAYANGVQPRYVFSNHTVPHAIDHQREEFDVPRAYVVAAYKNKRATLARTAPTWGHNNLFIVEDSPSSPLNDMDIVQYGGSWLFRREMLANLELTHPDKILCAPAAYFFEEIALRRGKIAYCPLWDAERYFAFCYEILVNVTLVLHHLPSFVLLWITQHLPFMDRWVALRCLRAIEGVQASIKALIEKRGVRK